MQEASKHLEQAVALSPETTAYRFDLANFLWDNVSHVPPSARRLLLVRAAEVAHEGLRVRPLDPDLHRLLGLAELRRFQWGGENRLVQAQVALQKAQVLDPHFGFTLELLAQVTALQGDTMKQREILSRVRGGI
jgi:predicted Zn-dependent protease